MKRIKQNHHRNRVFTAVLGSTLCAVSYGCDREAEQDQEHSFRSISSITQFSKVFVIGDSLSDTHRMGSGLIPYCPNPKRGYWNKRFSNGYLWIDYLTQDNPGIASKVVNYAVGGSGILKRYGSCIIGKTKKQVEDLLKAHDSSVVANSMVIVWAGSNDIKEAEKTGSASDFGHSVFDALKEESIERLEQEGVQHFVLVGLPRIDRVPVGASWSAAQREWVEIAVNTYNDDLEAYAGSEGHVYLDVADKINDIQDGVVTSVNMTDLATPCWDGPNCIEQGDIPGAYTDQRCEGKMFFDRVHPTTGAHCGIAKWMEQAISEQYEINGGDQDLETCAQRAQTDERSIKFKVQTPLNPNAVTCQSRCESAGGATWNGGLGNIDLPTFPADTAVGYCSCDG